MAFNYAVYQTNDDGVVEVRGEIGQWYCTETGAEGAFEYCGYDYLNRRGISNGVVEYAVAVPRGDGRGFDVTHPPAPSESFQRVYLRKSNVANVTDYAGVVTAWGRNLEEAVSEDGRLWSDGDNLFLEGVKIGIVVDNHGCAHWILSQKKMGASLAALAQSVIDGWPCGHSHYSWAKAGVSLDEGPCPSELEPIGTPKKQH